MRCDEEDLKQRLDEIRYHVTQENGTKLPYTNEYDNIFEYGIYVKNWSRSKAIRRLRNNENFE